jgi:hypothetical protein
MTAAEVTPFGEMPLNEKLKVFYCRTGNHALFQLFHLRHRLPGSAARIIAQNFASCRLASPFMETFFLVFIPSTPFPYDLAWVKMGCGISLNYHLYSDDTTGKNTKMAGKVNKVNPVFYERKRCNLRFPFQSPSYSQPHSTNGSLTIRTLTLFDLIGSDRKTGSLNQ